MKNQNNYTEQEKEMLKKYPIGNLYVAFVFIDLFFILYINK